MSIFDVLRQAATVAGAGVDAYGAEKKDRTLALIAQQKSARDAENDRIRNMVAMAGINPDLQGQIAGAKAVAEVKPAIDRAVGIETQTAPVRTKAAIDIKTAEAPIEQQTHAANRQFDITHEPKDRPVMSVQQPLTPGAPAMAVTLDPSDPMHPKSAPIPGVSKPATAAGGAGGVRGLGPGGVFGAGSGLGSVNEMKAANPNLKKFEQGFLNNTSDLTALDRFRQKLANDLQTHGFISAATSAEAERELASTNPDLAVYGRNLKQWVVSDMNLSRGGTDERARMDQAVSGLNVPLSSMPPEQRATFLNEMWEARDARLAGLVQSATAAKAILDRVSGAAGVPGGAPTPPAGGGSRAQQLWDAAVAKHGEAKVLQEFGPRPPE